MEKTNKKRSIIGIFIAVGAVFAVLMVALAMYLANVITMDASGGIGDSFDDPDYWVNGSSVSTVRSTRSQTNLMGNMKIKLSCGVVSGAKTLWRTTRDGAQASLSHEESWNEGRFRLVLVHEDGTAEDLTGLPSPYAFTTRSGDRLRYVADAATDVRLSISFDSGAGSWED